MTAPELHNLVKDWPREAWPKEIDLAYGEWYNTTSVTNIIDDAHAVLMHEASGVRWFREQDLMLTISPCADGDVGVKVGMGEWHTAPTLIAALSAAILAASKGDS